MDTIIIEPTPTERGMIQAVSEHNCAQSLQINWSRIQHFANRLRERGDSPNDIVIVAIHVDDTAFTRELADALMPGADWQVFRDKGEAPFARGLARREPIQDIINEHHPRAGEMLAELDGRIAVVVFDHGVAIVREVQS